MRSTITCGESVQVDDVRRHLDPFGAEAQAERLDAGQPSGRLPHGSRNVAGDVERSTQLEVERDERRAHTKQHGARRRVEPARAECRLELSCVDPPLQLARPAAAEEGRSMAVADLAVEEHGKPELSPPCANNEGDVDCPPEVGGRERDDRDDVGCADARMDAVVRPQVDVPGRLLDTRDEPLLHLAVVTDEGDDGAVVVTVDMRVEHPCASARERGGESSDHGRVPPLRALGTDSSRATARSLRPMREPTAPAYYDHRAPEYDDWYLGVGQYAERDRAGFDDDLTATCAVLSELAPASTLDVACGTGFLTRHLPGEITGLDQSARMLEVAAARLPMPRSSRATPSLSPSPTTRSTAS